jgi:hypothetical protein
MISKLIKYINKRIIGLISRYFLYVILNKLVESNLMCVETDSHILPAEYLNVNFP